MNLHPFTFASLEYIVGVTVLALLFERILILAGLTRGNTILLAIATIILSMLQQLVFSESSSLGFGLFLVIIGPIGGNRYDLTRTIQHGRRWWLSINDEKDS